MQLPAYRCSLPHFASEWKKKQLYILSCAFLKKGVKITFGEGFYTKVVLEAIMVQWVSKDFLFYGENPNLIFVVVVGLRGVHGLIIPQPHSTKNVSVIH